MADAVALAFAQSFPGLLPFAGMGIAFCLLSVLAVVVFMAIILTCDYFGDSLKNETQYVVVVYIPALGWLMGAIARLVELAKNLLRSLAALGTTDLVRLLLTIVAVIFAILFLVYQKPIMEGTYTFYEVTLYPILGFLFSVVNAIVLFIASWWPLWNFFWVEVFTVTGLIIRVAIYCTVAGNWQSISNFIVAFATGIRDTILGITAFLSSGDLLNGRIDFASGLTVLMGSFEELVLLFDCLCNYLDFFWTDLFALPSSPSLITALDCAGNIIVRAAQVCAISSPRCTHTTHRSSPMRLPRPKCHRLRVSWWRRNAPSLPAGNSSRWWWRSWARP